MQYSRDCMTITSNNLFFHFQKHPHLRGENVGRLLAPILPFETSPPAWGKLVRSEAWPHRLGNIPTCVGKTGGSRRTVHRPSETSPPAWGKRAHLADRRDRAGNIPTCVGKTSSLPERSLCFGKHPHLRGENSGVASTLIAPPETSPPAWGKPMPPDGHRSIERNIPTCVGKTVTLPIRQVAPRKHPHLRGENERPSR